MLQIREDQMNVFLKNICDRFHARMLRHIRAHYPRECAELAKGNEGDAPLLEFIVQVVSHGGGYGINTERALAGLIDLSICFGAGFEFLPEMDWARRILEDERLTGPAKIDAIFEALPEE